MHTPSHVTQFARQLRQAKRDARRRRPEDEGLGVSRHDADAVLRLGVVLMVVALVLCAIALIGR